MAPSRSRKTKQQPNKPTLSLASESPSRPISSFGGFVVQASPQPWTPKKVDEKGKGKQTSNHELWVDLFRPTSRSQVAVHKRKAEDVTGWLRDALDGTVSRRRYRRILCLSGPAGAGKSALIHALSSEEDLNYDVVEWTDEPRQMVASSSAWDRGSHRSGEAGGMEHHSRFSDFLSQSSHFSSLKMDGGGIPGPSVKVENARRIILLDDIPNLQYEPTRRAFHSALMNFIEDAHTECAPLIIVLTESTPRFDDWDPSGRMSNWKERSEETMSVRSVFPSTIRDHPAFTHITFNPIAPTLLRKALMDVIARARKLDPQSIPAPSSSEAKECVEAIIAISNGDIRSSLHALQLALQSSARTGDKRASKRTANGSLKSSRSRFDPSGREASLVVFHALGRILYNKRLGDPGNEDELGEDLAMDDDFMPSSTNVKEYELPGHLQHRARRTSRVDVDSLWRTIPMDSNTLQLYVHQNYVQFCDDVDQCCELVEHLSNAETLKTTHEEWLHAVVTDHYAFQLTVRGTLLALPSPVPRRGGQKMRGAAFFDYRRRLNGVQETLGGIAATQMGIQNGTFDNTDRPFVRSTLAEVDVETLATEVLPIVVRCRTLPSEIQDCLVTLDGTANVQQIELDDDLFDVAHDMIDSPRPTQSLQPLFGRLASQVDLLADAADTSTHASDESEIEDADS